MLSAENLQSVVPEQSPFWKLSNLSQKTQHELEMRSDGMQGFQHTILDKLERL